MGLQSLQISAANVVQKAFIYAKIALPDKISHGVEIFLNKGLPYAAGFCIYDHESLHPCKI